MTDAPISCPAPRAGLARPINKAFLPALLAVALTGASATSRAAGEASTAAHPIAGVWSWTLFDGKCTETRQYRGNGTVLSTSGEAVVEGTYQVTPQASEKGFYTITERVVRENGKADCYGDEPGDAGEGQVRHVQFSPARDRMIVCRDESLQACYGPLVRVEQSAQ
ncbi:MAG: hypothetical protein EOO54_07525 [Haliea sp.]|nr:MAG: hypothetical protein EOO54_07525 [Haliea sp.]